MEVVVGAGYLEVESVAITEEEPEVPARNAGRSVPSRVARQCPRAAGSGSMLSRMCRWKRKQKKIDKLYSDG